MISWNPTIFSAPAAPGPGDPGEPRRRGGGAAPPHRRTHHFERRRCESRGKLRGAGAKGGWEIPSGYVKMGEVISIVNGDYKPTYNWGGTTL